MENAVLKILAVGAGSCLGGIGRYLLSKYISNVGSSEFPWGTFAVNILGCLVIGVVCGLLMRNFQLSEPMKLFLTVGFCGGFTTFSTFANENYQLMGGAMTLTSVVYILATLLCGVGAVALGNMIAKP